MKPRNFRYAEVATVAGSNPVISDHRMLSMLMHENQHLRSLVEGKGRMTVDRDMQAELDRRKEHISNLQRQLQRAGADRERRTQQVADFDAKIDEFREQLVDQGATLRQSVTELEDRVERRHRLGDQRLKKEQDFSNELNAELARRNQELKELRDETQNLNEALAESEQARSDLQRLLSRIGRTPLAPLFRRRRGYRELETRWTDK